MIKYNNLKMKILDTVKIGSVVQVNLDSTKERLSEKTIKAISNSSKCIVKDYKITDGLGIGLVLELSNGDKEWFFENEVEIIDSEGNIINTQQKDRFSNFVIYKDNIKYETKSSLKKLLNPINFLSWLIFSIKDNL